MATELEARARRRSVRLTRWAVALTVISLLALWNWRVPVLRLDDFRANQLVLVVLLLLPIPAALLFAAGLGRRRRVIVLAALTPLLALDSCSALLVGRAFGLEARQERPLIPDFVNVVRVLGTWYPGSEGSVVRINPHRARVVTNGIPHSAIPEHSEFTLRRRVYF